MSLLALCTSTVTLKRGTEARTADGNVQVSAWTAVKEGIAVRFIDQGSGAGIQENDQPFGMDIVARCKALIPDGEVDIHLEDGLVVTDGERTGTRWRVKDVQVRARHAADGHFELQLESTQETLT